MTMEENAFATAFTKSGSSSAAMETIERYRQSEHLCDVVLISKDGQRFPAHRVILAAASRFFDRMFSGSFRESNQTEVALRNIDGTLLKMLMDFAYKGETTCPEAVENVLSLYEAAHYVQFDELFEMCSGWLKRHLDTSNCLSMAIVADRYDDSELRRVADCISAVNILALLESEEFLCLSVEHLSRIIAQDDLGVKSEDEVLIVVQKWVKYDELSRRDHVESLSKFIRFPLLDFKETSGVLSDLDLVSHYHSSDGSHQRRFGCQDVLLLAGGAQQEEVMKVAGYVASRQARIYNANSDMWNAFPSLAIEAARPGIATSRGGLYALGGYHSCQFDNGRITYRTTNVVQRYDRERRRWVDDVEHMSCPRRGHAIVGCDSRIYGMSLGQSQSRLMCEVFDPERQSWIAVSPPKQYFTHGYILSMLDNKVFAIGCKGDELGYMKYYPVENRWCELRPCTLPRRFSAKTLMNPGYCHFVSTGDRIYVHNSSCIRRAAAIFDSCSESFSFVDEFFPFTGCNGLAYDIENKRMYQLGNGGISIYEERAKKWDLRAVEKKFNFKVGCAVVDRKLINFVE